MTKPTKWYLCEVLRPSQQKWSVRPAKALISLGIHPVWSVFAVCSVGSQGSSVSSRGQQRLIRLSGFSLGAQVILLVLLCSGWNKVFVSRTSNRICLNYNSPYFLSYCSDTKAIPSWSQIELELFLKHLLIYELLNGWMLSFWWMLTNLDLVVYHLKSYFVNVLNALKHFMIKLNH